MSKAKYSASAQWADVTPIPLSDSSAASVGSAVQPLASIAYPPRYSEAMSYLRAVMAGNEFSERALALTQDVIGMNPAHYTVWLYRIKILRVLGEKEGGGGGGGGPGGYVARVTEELEWLDEVCRLHLKNYQIWHHRQTLVSALPAPPANEIRFLAEILALDTKNYHVWSYRQWLCRHFPALLASQEEMEATEAMILDDVRNNSAWNHRWFLCFGAAELEEREREDLESLKSGSGKGKGKGVAVSSVVDEDLIDREIEYTKAKIKLAPQNASAWNYLRGLVRKGGRDAVELEEFCKGFVGDDVLKEGKDGVRSSHAVEWLAELYMTKGKSEESRQYFDALSQKWDPVRKAYWEYRKGMMRE